MTSAEAIEASGRSESWLKRHTCAWCDQTLWRALRNGCGAIYEKCDPAQKDFSPAGRLVLPAQRDMTPDERAEMERLTANLDADVDSALLSSSDHRG